MTFETLNVRSEIVTALKREGIVNPTSIQEKAIPLILQGQDVIGMSRTGSGKTAAFSVPVLEQIQPKAGLQALVLAPTRELAVQIANEFRKFGKNLNISVATVFGGVGLEPQIHEIAKSQICVATPGRLLDHLQRGNIDVSRIKHFVLDEADKMVDMGFIDDVNRILQATPKEKQVLLFGATLSHEIERLKRQHMKDPQVAKAEAHVQEDFLEQYYYNVQNHEKFSLLVHMLKKEQGGSTMIFCSTIHTVDLVTSNLRAQGIKAEAIHGKMSQNKRLSVIGSFNKSKFPVLVASAVAARGLHIDDVQLVVNYDLSKDPEEYIHRVGRTARAGETGKAVTLLSDKDHGTFSSILRTYPVTVNALEKEQFEKIPFKVGARRGSYGGRGRFGQRRSFGGPRRSAGPRSGQRSHRPRRR